MDIMNKTVSNLRAVSMQLLQAGTCLTEDIYCYDYRLLSTSGMFLDNDMLYKLKGLNHGREIFYVTYDTYKKLLDGQIESRRQALEEKTGYTAVKQGTVELLDEIAKSKKVDLNALSNVLVELSKQLKSSNTSTIVSLINALAPVGEYLQRHCVNTGLLNGLIGRWLGLGKGAVDRLVLIGLLHDCGKALMPPSVLNAPRKLSGVEYQVIKNHSVRSYELLTDFPSIVRLAVRSHHERIDGTGYPDRLRNSDIPIEARITAVSDIYDAMVSQRTYKSPHSPFSVMAHFKGLSGSALDAGLVNLFMRHMPSKLVGKQVMLSDGSIGTISSVDIQEIEYPTITIEGRAVKTDHNLFCTSMY